MMIFISFSHSFIVLHHSFMTVLRMFYNKIHFDLIFFPGHFDDKYSFFCCRPLPGIFPFKFVWFFLSTGSGSGPNFKFLSSIKFEFFFFFWYQIIKMDQNIRSIITVKKIQMNVICFFYCISID